MCVCAIHFEICLSPTLFLSLSLSRSHPFDLVMSCARLCVCVGVFGVAACPFEYVCVCV